MPYADTRSGRLFYVRRSARRAGAVPAVFVHGAGGNALLWGAVLGRLPGVEAVALDLPGHGRSAGQGCTEIGAYADAVTALVDALGFGEVILVGHSLGGGIALEVALRAPARVRGLALMSTLARLFVAPSLLQQLVADPVAARRWIVETGYGCEAGAHTKELGAAQLAGVPAGVLHGDFVACSAYDARARLGEIAAPALVLCGSDDRLTPPKYVRALAEGLPQARFELIPGAGHMLPMEAPDALAAALAPFLA